MLLFRSEEMVDRWCRNWGQPRGAILSPATCWMLAREWYQDRRDPQWRRRTVDETHALFNRLGLTEDFWKLN
jgi:Alkylmercury lyase